MVTTLQQARGAGDKTRKHGEGGKFGDFWLSRNGQCVQFVPVWAAPQSAASNQRKYVEKDDARCAALPRFAAAAGAWGDDNAVVGHFRNNSSDLIKINTWHAQRTPRYTQ